MRLEEIYINGVGTCIPDRMSTAEAVQRGWYDAQEAASSGLVSIAIANDTPAPDLAISAAQIALKQDSVAASGVGLLLHSHVHPQGPEGWATQHYINLHTVNRPIPASEIVSGCNGMMASIMLGATWLSTRSRSYSDESVLITAGDNVGTPAADRWHISFLYVMGDAGASILLSRRPGIAKVLSIASVSDPSLEQLSRGDEPIFPPGITVGKKLEFNSKLAYFREKAPSGEISPGSKYRTIVARSYREALDDAGLTADDVARVTHVGFTHRSLRKMFLDPLNVSDERSVWDFTRHVGHAGPPDPILGLDHLLTTGGVRRGDVVALTSGSPGMEASCAILRIIDI
ncbi:MAG: ketoacyl-ACP synthase III family protein [Nocardiopsaceae bacterium]|nr:ketoacyl-ACP synthase III family protein [Nocardiopsaceae bacterium]